MKKKFQFKKKKQTSAGDELGVMAPEASALCNEPRNHHLSNDQIYNI